MTTVSNGATVLGVSTNVAPVTGMDLKVQRIRRRVSTAALAEVAGWKARSRISQIESLAVVPPESARRYLDALETFPAFPTSSGAA